MAPTTRRRRNQTEKREALLDAAITLFRSKGIAETTVEDVTQAAGVAKGTFYLYFQTKDDLLDDLRVEFAQQIEIFFGEAEPPEAASEWPAYLTGLMGAAVDRIVEQRDLHDLLMALPHAHAQGALASAVAGAQSAIRDILQEGVRVGALDVVDIEATAWLLFDFINAAGDRASVSPGDTGRYRRTCANAVEKWLLRKSA